MGSALKVAVCQLTSLDDFSHNLDQILSYANQAADQDVEIIFFPENSLYFRIRTDDRFPGFDPADPIFDPLLSLAKTRDICIHLGGIPLNEGGAEDEIYNASVIICKDGMEIPYRKTHLFDIDLKGKERVCESDYFTAGDKWTVWNWNGWCIGQTICFDVRFPEMYRYLVELGAEAFSIPSAFIMSTGKAHWELLVRTRAVETQSYVFAAAQQGEHKGIHGGVKNSWGHSMIVDPWGTTVAASSIEIPLIITEIDKENVRQLRRDVPLAQHRISCKVK